MVVLGNQLGTCGYRPDAELDANGVSRKEIEARNEVALDVHRPIGFGVDEGEEENFVDEAREISSVLGGLGRISLGIMRRFGVVVDWQRLILMGDLNFEEVAVDYICRHLGVTDVDAVDVGVSKSGVINVGVVDVGDGDVGDVDVGALLDSVSRSEVSLGLLITQSSVVTAFGPSQVSEVPSPVY